MTYYNKKDYKLLGYRKSTTKYKKYDGMLQNRKTKKIINVPFGDVRYSNFHDLTGLNLYKNLLHKDIKRRRLFRSRMKHNLNSGYYSPSWFSYFILW